MKLTDTQLSKLSTMNADQTGQWFLNGFKDWFDPDRHYDAFPPIVSTFSSYKDITEQLQKLHALLPEELRSRWCTGLALAVRRCPKADSWLLSLREVFSLANRLCAYKVITEIEQKWIGEYLLSPWSQEAKQTRAVLINLLAGWTYEPKARELLADLLISGYFEHKPQINDVPIVFVMLLKANPEKLGWLLEKTRHLFLKLIDEDDYFLSGFAASLVSQVKLQSLVRNFDQLKIDLPPSKNATPIIDDKWLIATLFGYDRERLTMFEIKVINNYQPALEPKKIYDNRIRDFTRILVNSFTKEITHIDKLNEDNTLNNIYDEIFSYWSILKLGALAKYGNLDEEANNSPASTCVNPLIKNMIPGIDYPIDKVA